MNKPCEYCGHDLPMGVDKNTRQTRSRHFEVCEVRLSEKSQEADQQQYANAYLIAAAPELLEAVKQMQSVLSRCFGAHGSDEGDRHRALAQAHTVIAKATGDLK